MAVRLKDRIFRGSGGGPGYSSGYLSSFALKRYPSVSCSLFSDNSYAALEIRTGPEYTLAADVLATETVNVACKDLGIRISVSN
jgi:hypothetical protein